MKFEEIRRRVAALRVAPHVGAWIEISPGSHTRSWQTVAPHVGAWIEIYDHQGWCYSC